MPLDGRASQGRAGAERHGTQQHLGQAATPLENHRTYNPYLPYISIARFTLLIELHVPVYSALIIILVSLLFFVSAQPSVPSRSSVLTAVPLTLGSLPKVLIASSKAQGLSPPSPLRQRFRNRTCFRFNTWALPSFQAPKLVRRWRVTLSQLNSTLSSQTESYFSFLSVQLA